MPTPSNPMSSSGDFPDIQDSITTKCVYLPLKFKTVYVAALLDSGSGIYVISLSLYNIYVNCFCLATYAIMYM